MEVKVLKKSCVPCVHEAESKKIRFGLAVRCPGALETTLPPCPLSGFLNVFSTF